MKSLIALFRVILEESGIRCGISTTRDFKTVSGRFEHEGISFLTISLTNFGKDFQKSLDQGFVGHDQFMGYARTGGLPRLFGGFLDRVFDRSSGRLLDEPCIDAVRAIRQLTLMYGKINLDCSSERVKSAISKYIETERNVRHYDKTFKEENSGISHYSRFRNMSVRLWGQYFSDVENDLFNSRECFIPKHGPGATADGLRGNSKYRNSEWTDRLDRVFPSWETLIPNERFLGDLESVSLLSPGAERPVRVITVPKTLKTPRIIAIEPTCMQYMQQAILEQMVQKFRTNDNARNFVLFDSQEPNQLLAWEGSVRRNLATLDLSEASDRVSNQHVRALLENHPLLQEAVDSTRSRKADVPGHGVIRLAKFASMGSALCFPFEAMVFATVIFLGIERQLNRPLTVKDFKSFYGKVRVYGDDIIVPIDYVQSVVAELETFGFRVNNAKSFWTGKFRESCGKDYYDGEDVTVLYLRSVFPRSRQHVSEVISITAFRNQLYKAGYWKTCAWLDDLIREIGPFPDVQETSPLIGRLSYLPSQGSRFDNDLHVPLVKGMVAVSRPPIDRLDGSGALMKWFLKRGDTPFEDKDHLERAGRPNAARIKVRWAPPF